MNINSAINKYRDKIIAKIDKSKGNNKCWNWLGRITPKGYGRYAIYPKSAFYAHRLVWILYGNTISTGMVLDHICRNRACVNPNHLRLVSIAQNTLENSESPSAKNKKKIVCVKGHALLIKYKSGRRCKECDSKREKDRIRIINGKIYPVSKR